MKPKKTDKKMIVKIPVLRRFCPSCGKTTEDLFEGLCSECFLKNTELVRGKKRIELGICYDCHRARFNKFWREFPGMGAIIQDVITRNIKPRHGVILRTHYSEFVIKGKTEVPVKIDATLSIGGKDLSKKYDAEIVIFPEICPECSRLRGGYYEAIMQLRGEHKDEMRKYAETHIHNYAKDEPNAFITKVEELKEGTDLYIGSQKAGRMLSVAMRKAYNVQCTITKKIHGMRQGKEISRWTIFLGPDKSKNSRDNQDSKGAGDASAVQESNDSSVE